jgi:hypothetical protein
MLNSSWLKEVFVCKKLWKDIETFSNRNPKLCGPREEQKTEEVITCIQNIPLTEAILNVIADAENNQHGTLLRAYPLTL